MDATQNANQLTDSDLETIVNSLAHGATIGDVCNISDTQIESLYALAYNLYGSGNFADANTLFQSLCLYRQNDQRFWMGLGGCRQAQEDYKGAIDAYSIAGVVASLADPEPFFFASQCYIRLGDKENAIAGLKGLLTLGDPATHPEHKLCHDKAQVLLDMLTKE